MLALEDSQTCAGVTESDVVALYSRQIGEERLWLMCPIGRLTHPRAESVHQTHERAGLEETSNFLLAKLRARCTAANWSF